MVSYILLSRFRFPGRPYVLTLVCLATLFLFYSVIAWMVSGGDAWWHLDIVAGTNVYWGDDAYRYFLSRAAWSGLEIYTFNFVLPAQLLLDGVITTITDGELWVSRAIHGVFAAVAVFSVARAAQLAGAFQWAAIAAGVVLAFMPVYVFLVLSFYGEAWFVILISIALWAHAADRNVLGSLVVSLLPLVRPEGIYFVVAFFIFWAVRREWLFMMLPVSAGGIYLVFLLFSVTDASVFFEWRMLVSDAYAQQEFWFKRPLGNIGGMFSWIWLALAAIGIISGKSRYFWPFAGAAVAIVVFFVGALAQERMSYEPRYLLGITPVLSFFFAVGLDRVTQFRSFSLAGLGRRAVVVGVVPVVLVSHFMQMHSVQQVRDFYIENYSLPAEIFDKPLLDAMFRKKSNTEIDDYKEAADFVERLARTNREVKYIGIGNIYSLYFLDPQEVPDDVAVGFPIFGWGAIRDEFDETVPMYFPKYPYFGYFDIGDPRITTNRMIFVERIGLEEFPFKWTAGEQEVYIFGYRFTRTMKAQDDDG